MLFPKSVNRPLQYPRQRMRVLDRIERYLLYISLEAIDPNFPETVAEMKDNLNWKIIGTK